mgnify:CR=1 FL=1
MIALRRADPSPDRAEDFEPPLLADAPDAFEPEPPEDFEEPPLEPPDFAASFLAADVFAGVFLAPFAGAGGAGVNRSPHVFASTGDADSRVRPRAARQMSKGDAATGVTSTTNPDGSHGATSVQGENARAAVRASASMNMTTA